MKKFPKAFLFDMMLYFSADGYGEGDFQKIEGQENKHSCRQGAEEGDTCGGSQPESADEVHGDHTEKESQSL